VGVRFEYAPGATPIDLGEAAGLIPAHLTLQCDLNEYEEANILAYSPVEIAARYHHRLVAIHVFPNGNGRHARLMADLLLMELAGHRFEWGRGSLVAASELRARYIAALRAADDGDIRPLLLFLEP
jgi:fido (protein-threonine AMPylation protein)